MRQNIKLRVLSLKCVMTWFRVQFIAFQRDGKYSWLQHLRLVNIFRHVGKPAIIAQRMQRVACNKVHMKPRHYARTRRW